MITHNGCALSSLTTHNCYALLLITSYCRENCMRLDTYAPDIYLRETYRRTYQENFHPVLNENYLRDAPYNLTFYPPNINKEWVFSTQGLCKTHWDDKNLMAYKLVSDKYVSPLTETTTSYHIKNCLNARRFQRHGISFPQTSVTELEGWSTHQEISTLKVLIL
ncbi:hypothetical protein M9H77_28053 [Catharanthus roseus]|uniref:Uncharacterized protein n=1 Tax=Catharanthus roseus TaxID=4058 RepID=A0ACC0AEG1_CATRO|nr:hypothetical protein M9H77_28053 [Catharanthus roseus]